MIARVRASCRDAAAGQPACSPALAPARPRPLCIPRPPLQVKVEKNTTVEVSGFDKELVGQFAANIRSKREPEPYKGKGVR